MAMHNVNGTGWHQATEKSQVAAAFNSIRHSPTQQLNVTQIASANSISQQSLVQQQHQQQQVLSSSPVLQLQNAQAAQAVAAQQAAAQHAAAQQAQAYPSGISEQNYGGTTYFIPENQKQTHVICGPPYMAFPGVSTDTSVAYLERTIQMKVNARASFFVGEGTFHSFLLLLSIHLISLLLMIH
jgi:hypothetical protein